MSTTDRRIDLWIAVLGAIMLSAACGAGMFARHPPVDPEPCLCFVPARCPARSGLSRCFRAVQCGIEPCEALGLDDPPGLR